MNENPRILFLTCNAPRDTGSGGEIVSWRLLRTYAEFASVDVISLVPSDQRSPKELEEIAGRVALVELPHFYFARSRFRNAWIFARAQLGSEPFRIGKMRSPEFSRIVREWSHGQRYDLVHCDYLSTSPYRGICADLPAVLAEHNVEWQSFARLAEERSNPIVKAALRRDSRRTADWEASALEDFQHTLTLSELDRELLVDARPDLADRISVWPVPVQVRDRSARTEGPLRVLILGSLRSIGRLHGLRWFLEEVWGPVRDAVPDAQLEIVGAEPPEDVLRCDGRDGCHVHGFVEDLEPIVDRTDVCAIPLAVGAGIRVKVLELIARGVPCIGTPTALQGLSGLGGCVEAVGREEWVSLLVAAGTNGATLRAAAARGASDLATTNSVARAVEHLKGVVEGLGTDPAPSGAGAEAP